jgi:hypothetical protein
MKTLSIEVAAVKAVLVARAEEVCRFLLPEGRRVGNEWRVGNINGDAGNSMSIVLTGREAGLWKDFAVGDKASDLLGLWMKVKQVTFREALEQVARWAGLPTTGDGDLTGASEAVEGRCRAVTEKFSSVSKTPTVSYAFNPLVEAVGESDLATLAQQRGISPGFCAHLKEAGLIGMKDGGWAFPVAAANGTVVGCHYRKDDGSWRYDPPGIETQPFYFGPAKPKVVVAGESQWDVLAIADKLGVHRGEHADYGFFATRGAANGRLLRRAPLAEAQKVFLVPQNDAPRADGKVPSEEWWLSASRSIEGRPVFRAEVPKEFKDANDWLKTGDVTREVLSTVLAGAKPAHNGKLPPMDDAADFMPEEACPSEPPQIVRGILHLESKIVIGGPSKARKTWSLLDLAVSVATGTSWWGFSTEKHRVCYINFELQRTFAMRRLRDICRAKGITLQRGQLRIWTLRGHVEGMEKMLEDILSELANGDFKLVIFDPIYKALGDRDENKAGDVASLLNLIERVAVKLGAAVAFGAHFSKGNQASKDSMDRIGGSGVFARDPDSILTLTAHEEADCFTIEPVLRNFAPVPAFVIRWQWPLFHRDDELNPANLKQPNPRNNGGNNETGKPGRPKDTKVFEPDAVLGLLPAEGLTTSEWRSLAVAKLGCSAATFDCNRALLVDDGRIKKVGNQRGKWFRMTPELSATSEAGGELQPKTDDGDPSTPF